MRTRIKFCGCTSARDAELAVECGVDAVGVIFAPSPRRVSPEAAREIARAVPAFVSLVGVFVEPDAGEVARARDDGYLTQFSGDEAAVSCEAAAVGPYLKVAHVRPQTPVDEAVDAFEAAAPAYARATWMLDTAIDGKHGGTGRSFDWEIACRLAGARPIVVCGGLTPENVESCIRRVRPFGVDVRSGIESGGVKDRRKMRAFVRAVKEADEQT